jgi:hypothetical protein
MPGGCVWNLMIMFCRGGGLQYTIRFMYDSKICAS